jgi:hypothetical protein
VVESDVRGALHEAGAKRGKKGRCARGGWWDAAAAAASWTEFNLTEKHTGDGGSSTCSSYNAGQGRMMSAQSVRTQFGKI